MAKKPRLLFLCTGNSARSQMAEGFARYYAGDAIEVESAGTRPAGVNPNAVWAMNEVGIDIRQQTSDALESKDLSRFDYVVTLCGHARQACPVLPSGVKSEHWPMADPAAIRGTPGDVIKGFRLVRFQIEERVKDLIPRLKVRSSPG